MEQRDSGWEECEADYDQPARRRKQQDRPPSVEGEEGEQRSSAKRARITSKQQQQQQQEEQPHWKAIDDNLRMMDRKWEGHFHTWIRDERNAKAAGHHLRRVVNDYGIERLAFGLRWLFIDWRLSSIVRLLSALLRDGTLSWEREAALLASITHDWRVEHAAELLLLLYPQQHLPIWLVLQQITQTARREAIRALLHIGSAQS